MSKSLLAGTVLLCLTGCCGTPVYTPAYWNDGGTVQHSNNCYNYANNKRTDTFAQPGRAAGLTLGWGDLADCTVTSDHAVADGIDRWPDGGRCKRDRWYRRHTKIALVLAPNWDYHWYRRDRDGNWTHKPGGTRATNLDNSGNVITDPRTADRGPYTVFCGFFCSCSSSREGKGHEVIK
jgi:hypothetical protein